MIPQDDSYIREDMGKYSYDDIENSLLTEPAVKYDYDPNCHDTPATDISNEISERNTRLTQIFQDCWDADATAGTTLSGLDGDLESLRSAWGAIDALFNSGSGTTPAIFSDNDTFNAALDQCQADFDKTYVLTNATNDDGSTNWTYLDNLMKDPSSISAGDYAALAVLYLQFTKDAPTQLSDQNQAPTSDIGHFLDDLYAQGNTEGVQLLNYLNAAQASTLDADGNETDGTYFVEQAETLIDHLNGESNLHNIHVALDPSTMQINFSYDDQWGGPFGLLDSGDFQEGTVYWPGTPIDVDPDHDSNESSAETMDTVGMCIDYLSDGLAFIPGADVAVLPVKAIGIGLEAAASSADSEEQTHFDNAMQQQLAGFLGLDTIVVDDSKDGFKIVYVNGTTANSDQVNEKLAEFNDAIGHSGKGDQFTLSDIMANTAEPRDDGSGKETPAQAYQRYLEQQNSTGGKY
jgi:hypothetical protein